MNSPIKHTDDVSSKSPSTLFLAGDIGSFSPPDLLQWAAGTATEGILHVASGGYRFRFQDGALCAATIGPPDRFLKSYFENLEGFSDNAAELIEGHAAAGRLLTPSLLAESSDPEGVFFALLNDVLFRFLRETEGRFLLSSPAEPLPAEWPAPVPLFSLLLEASRLNDELSRFEGHLPSRHAHLEWSSSGPLLAEPLIPALRSMLQDGPKPAGEIIDQLAGPSAEIYRLLGDLGQKGFLRVHPRDAGSQELGSCLELVREPTPDEYVLLTKPQLEALDRLRAGRSSVRNLLSLSSTKLSEDSGLAAALCDGGWAQPVTATSQHRSVRKSVVAAGGLALAVGVGWWNATSPTEPVDESLKISAATADRASVTSPAEATDISNGTANGADESQTDQTVPAPAEESELADATTTQKPEPVEPRVAQEPNRRELSAGSLERARAALERGDTEQAVAALGQALAHDPDNRDARQLLSESLQPSRRDEPALETAAVPLPGPQPAPRDPPSATSEESDVVAESSVEVVAEPEPTPEPERVTVVVNAVPYARIFVDGQDLGLTPLRLDLTVGVHRIEARREGYETEIRQYDVSPDIDNVVAFVLQTNEE